MEEESMEFLWEGLLSITWQQLLMYVVGGLLIWLAIEKGFEPALLLPMGFGAILVNLPLSGVINQFSEGVGETHGIIQWLFEVGIEASEAFPILLFIGIGAMIDFGPLLANPKLFLCGAAAQAGIFLTILLAAALGFDLKDAASIGIIGAADGPTAIYTTSHLAPHLLGPIAVAAYSYMALVPVIQPPIMKALTTDKERKIKMKQLRPVSKTEKILFPIIVTIFVSFLVPSAASLVGCLMLGNLMRECGVVERLSKTVQNELMNIVTIFLGVSVGATATAATAASSACVVEVRSEGHILSEGCCLEVCICLITVSIVIGPVVEDVSGGVSRNCYSYLRRGCGNLCIISIIVRKGVSLVGCTRHGSISISSCTRCNS